MVYVPNPKDVIYNELNFVSVSSRAPKQKPSMDAIFDEVSSEIYALFVNPVSVPAVGTVGEAVRVSEVLG